MYKLYTIKNLLFSKGMNLMNVECRWQGKSIAFDSRKNDSGKKEHTSVHIIQMNGWERNKV